MSEPTAANENGQRWYARPVLFVDDIQRAIRFYVERLGFWKKWHEADGAGTVCQVNRTDCEIILCQDAARRDRGRLFVELNPGQLDALRHELSDRQVPFDQIWWGYDCIRVVDPDGNDLLFPIA